MPATPDPTVLKSAREQCHKARDEFYACVEASGAPFSLDAPAGPSACRRQRAAYEASCRASWVRHFDQLHDKKLRLLQTLQGNIGRQATGALGSLAGKEQR